MKKIILLLFLVLLIGCQDPENHDDLAKCLTEKGMVMYGSVTCGHCNTVKSSFGESFQYIDYIECGNNIPGSQIELCNERNIRYLPTFELGNETLTGSQKLMDLAIWSGCGKE